MTFPAFGIKKKSVLTSIVGDFTLFSGDKERQTGDDRVHTLQWLFNYNSWFFQQLEIYLQLNVSFLYVNDTHKNSLSSGNSEHC